MSETAKTIRGVCLRQTEDNFYLAVTRPFNPQLLEYKRFRNMAARCVVQMLEEGSQVFVYPREEFKSDDHIADFTDVDLFQEQTILTAQELHESLAIDPHVTPVGDKMAPFSRDSIRV